MECNKKFEDVNLGLIQDFFHFIRNSLYVKEFIVKIVSRLISNENDYLLPPYQGKIEQLFQSILK